MLLPLCFEKLFWGGKAVEKYRRAAFGSFLWALSASLDASFPREYRVRPGDTLWKICQDFLGDPSYWPKLWAENPGIENPRFIWPGMRLSLELGDALEPPRLLMAAPRELPLERVDLKDSLFKEESPSPAEALLKEGEALEEEESPLEKEELRPPVTYRLPGFVDRAPMEPLGHVLGGMQGEEACSPGMEAMVRLQRSISTGEVYTFVRKGQELWDASWGNLGRYYTFVAHGRAKSFHRGGPVLFELLSGGPVEIGDLLVPFRPRQRHLPSLAPGERSFQGRLGHIMAFGDRDRVMGGPGDWVLLSKGQRQGYRAGEYMEIYSRFQDVIHPWAAGKVPWGARSAGRLTRRRSRKRASRCRRV